jgi:hypothetical protein
VACRLACGGLFREDEGYFRQFGRTAAPATVTTRTATARRPGQARAVSHRPLLAGAVRHSPQHIPAGARPTARRAAPQADSDNSRNGRTHNGRRAVRSADQAQLKLSGIDRAP